MLTILHLTMTTSTMAGRCRRTPASKRHHSMSPQPYKQQTSLWYCYILLVMALILSKVGANTQTDEEHQEPALKCREVDNSIVCELSIPKGETEVVFMTHCQDDYCLRTTSRIEKVARKQPKDEKQQDDFVDGLLENYQPPFHQYGRNIGRILGKRPTKQPFTLEEVLNVADWYSELGKAHRLDATMAGILDWNKMNVKECINVFQHAILHYKRALELNANNEAVDIHIALAAAESFVAEAFLLHPTNPHHDRALEYFMNAQEHYKIALESKTLSKLEQQTVERNMADTMGHAASLLLEDSGGLDISGGGTAVSLDVTRFLESAEKADKLLGEAIEIYRKTIQSSVGQDKIFYQLQLANSLHNHGTAKMLTSTVGRAIVVMEESLSAFESVISQVHGADKRDAIMGMAEVLQSLSDAYLQAGNYEKAKSRYKNAMEWYQKHKLAPPQVPIVRSDELLAEMEQQLSDYHASLAGGGGGGDIQLPDEYARAAGVAMYEPDERYEGDLYAALGSIELSHGQIELAMTYFVKAIGLYEEVGGEDRAIADVKFNMAGAQFRLGKFEESMTTHGEALDIYRQVVGDGKNPLVVDNALLKDVGLDTGVGTESDEVRNAENENAFRTQLVNMDALQQNLANMTAKDEL